MYLDGESHAVGAAATQKLLLATDTRYKANKLGHRMIESADMSIVV